MRFYSLNPQNSGADESAPYIMRKLLHLYSLSPWRERVRVRG